MAEPRRSDTSFRDEAAQQALGAVLGANPFVRLDPTELLATGGHVGLAAARPGLLARHARLLGRELAAIAAGRSEVRPGRGDRRFSDTAWTEMPLYRRLMQGYLAASSQVQRLIDDVPVDDRERARARFLATIVTEALAPTNLLAGNPAALKRTFETGGANLVRGVRHIGMPNIVAGHEVVPELLQGRATGEGIAAAARGILESPARRAEIVGELRDVRRRLGRGGAAGRAATMAAELLGAGERA